MNEMKTIGGSAADDQASRLTKDAFPFAAKSNQTSSPILVHPDGACDALARVTLMPGNGADFDEAWLQRLIHRNPECLPFQEIEPGLDRFLPVCRELATPHGHADNLLMTVRGDIAIVETKLFRNPEARRMVLAQVLDYAASIFAMSYTDFEKAVLASDFSPAPKPASLYEALPDAEKLAEADFIDAVQRNLRRGRALLLVVGDGIRGDAERLLDGLQACANYNFVLSLVELAVYRMPRGDGLLVRPSTLVKTVIAQRTVVEVSGTGVVATREERPAVPETMTSEGYWDALERTVPGARAALNSLIETVKPLGVFPEMLATLNLKKERAGGKKPLNLGYISKAGSAWQDAACWDVPMEIGRSYVAEIAATFGGVVHTSRDGKFFSAYKDGKPMKLASMLSRLNEWAGPMERFINAVSKSDESAEQASTG